MLSTPRWGHHIFSALPSRNSSLDASPKAISGRTSYLRVRLEFHPYPQVIAAVFNRRAFGPPRGLTPASACPRIAHPASRPRRGTQVALLRLAFASAPFRLTSPRASDSLAHSTKGTPSQLKSCSDCSWAHGFRYCFTPLPGCFSPFPHGTGALSVTG